MDVDIKKINVDFWTENVPYNESLTEKELLNTVEFYKKIDNVRYRQEPYLKDFFSEILEPGLVALEAGCGLGNDLRYFSQSGLRITGLDYSPENAYISKLGFKVCNLTGRVICGDAESLPFPDDSFDLVYSWGCLHHSPNTQESINELLRVLRPGGKAMVMLYHKGYQFWYILLRYLVGFKWLRISLQKYINLKYDQTPLSQMFTKKQLYKMFKNFNKPNIRVVTYGAIQFHPILKYVWMIFQNVPWLLKRYGSFAVVFANKGGKSPLLKEPPQLCCPACHSIFEYHKDSIKCSNSECRNQFFYYRKEIPVLHSNITKGYCERMEKESILS